MHYFIKLTDADCRSRSDATMPKLDVIKDWVQKYSAAKAEELAARLEQQAKDLIACGFSAHELIIVHRPDRMPEVIPLLMAGA